MLWDKYFSYLSDSIYKYGLLGIIPGSVHWVRFRNIKVKAIEAKYNIEIVGFVFQIWGNMKTQYKTKAEMNAIYTKALKQQSDFGPVMQPQGRNRLP